MNIGFTGHRNKLAKTTDLERIAQRYPSAVWVHGGAVGFDTQVEQYAQAHGIKTVVIRPDYENNSPKFAPLKRNIEIVAMSDAVVALWDGRCKGGTYFTIKSALGRKKPVEFLTPVD